MEIQLQLLLDKIDVIRLRQTLTSSTDHFNIFRILRSESDEVNLHSRFLYELLNPKGSHRMGKVFLQHFAEICGLPSLSYNNVELHREYANIDILIQDGQHAIVIENKIYAGDQHEQLKRYHEYATRSHRKPTLLYLTLEGREPSAWSIGNLSEQIKTASYSGQVDQWLTVCIKESATQPALRETLSQYQTLIRQLTGNNMSEKEKHEVLALMAQDSNAEKAVIIAQNWGHVRWHTEWDFWNELLALVENKFEVSPSGQFSADALDKAVHGRRGRSPYYGLSFCIGTLQSTPVNLRIERNEGPMYYGIPYCTTDASTRSRIRTSVQDFAVTNTEGWAGLKSNALDINFESFNNSTTLQLANPEKRRKIIGDLWQEITLFINEVTQALQKEFTSDFIPV